MLDRRGFAGLLALGAAGIWPRSARAQPAPPAGAVAAGAKDWTPKAEDFARDHYMSSPCISPDGQRLAWVRGDQIVIYDRVTEAERVLPSAGNRLEGIAWINNDYLVVYLHGDVAYEGNVIREIAYSPLIITKDAKFVRVLFEHDGKPVSAADLKPIVRFIDGPAPYVITFYGNNTYLTDIATGKWKVGPRTMTGNLHYFDKQGEERVAVEFLDAKPNYGVTDMVYRYRVTAGGSVKELRPPKRDKLFYINFHFAEAENALYWIEFDGGPGKASVVRYDLASATRSVVKTGNNKTLDVTFDDDGRLVGFTTVGERRETEWTDPFRLKLIGAVQRLFPNATVDVNEVGRDGKNVVLWISAPDAPDSYYLYNADSKQLDEIGTDYPELEDKPLAQMTYVTYKARDGLEIPAYVTKRKDVTAKAPLIVMPHGGPAARDVYGFNYMAQFLASRGYIVLQPQYRGSVGFGDAFQLAGDKHLDQMTADLEDGVKFLQVQGMIDPARVCVFGWSWGGYLAQAALAFTPNTWCCGVSGAGVADLYEALDDGDDFWFGGYSRDYWRSVIGQPMLDAAKIHATSPIEHIDAIKAPLLLIHGGIDRVVSVHQSERMSAAMQKAGKKVTYLPVKYMGHGPETTQERLTVLQAIDRFVAEAFAQAGKA